jgi:hypothetical protein
MLPGYRLAGIVLVVFGLAAAGTHTSGGTLKRATTRAATLYRHQ